MHPVDKCVICSIPYCLLIAAGITLLYGAEIAAIGLVSCYVIGVFIIILWGSPAAQAYDDGPDH